MANSIFVRGARQLLTLRGPATVRRGEAARDLGIIEDGSLLIVDGIIESVGPTRRIENLSRARGAQEISASGHVVMPGFVDSRTHLLAGGSRFAFENGRMHARAERDESVASPLIAEIRNTPASRLEYQAKRGVEFLVRHGTTTAGVLTSGGLDAPGHLKLLRVVSGMRAAAATVVPIYFGGEGTPPDFGGSADEYLEALCSEQMPKIAARDLAPFAAVRCARRGFSAAQAGVFFDRALRLGFRVKLDFDDGGAGGAVQAAADAGASSVDGLAGAGPDDVRALARADTVATLLPARARGVDAPRAPSRALLNAGAAIAIGTDFHSAKPSTCNMQMAVAIACAEMGLTPEEAITGATINGAHALAAANACGSLEFGKQADLIMLNASDYREIAHHFGANGVSMTMRKGEVVYREGEVAWRDA